jgi:hypothetical protein
MNMLFLIPKEGVRVVEPISHTPLPAEGALVEESTYWLRRLRDGDVTAEVPAAKPAKTTSK